MSFVHRPIVMSDRGMVVSGHHAASEAGADMLRRGGNACDAAIAAAATLCVAIPHMNGIGGDAFALHYDAASARVTAINGSGAAPQAATVRHYRDRGLAEIPMRGPLSLSVCGLVDAWESALARFGTVPLAAALEPAIALAETGVPLDLNLQAFLSSPLYRELAELFPALAAQYGPALPRPLGQRLRQPALAESLRRLARDGGRTLYGGALGRDLVGDLQRDGALLTLDDLAAHRTRFDTALAVPFRGAQVYAAPPNSQGLALAALIGLSEAWHRRHGAAALEPGACLHVKRLAFALRDKYCGDPARVDRPDRLLGDAHLDALLEASPALDGTRPVAGGGDTSTLVAIDRWGNAVSWVQSLFEEFGSAIVSPSTGIVMHDRLYLERLDDDPVRGLRPGMRPFHTLCPALVVRDGCELAIATPGDHGQPQAIFQVIANLYDRGMNLQEAIEAPRWRHDSGPDAIFESRAPADWAASIAQAGYEPVPVEPWARRMGGVNAILRSTDGLLMGGSDPRRACHAVAA